MTDELDAPLHAAFVESWDEVEKYYRESFLTDEAWQWLAPILALMEGLRAAGYDKVFRAGQSMWHLGLSRSRRHGLRDDQPSLWIEIVRNDGMMVRLMRHGPTKSIRLSTTSMCPELVSLLEELKGEPIT